MARFKPYDYTQMKLVPVSFKEQILPGTFEYTLNHLIDHEVDLSVFEHRYCNDETGAPAYDPAILLKVILYAYSRGITSSCQIERLTRENVVFMALSADSAPHFTTIADFIARLDAEIVPVFGDVLRACDEADPVQAAWVGQISETAGCCQSAACRPARSNRLCPVPAASPAAICP